MAGTYVLKQTTKDPESNSNNNPQQVLNTMCNYEPSSSSCSQFRDSFVLICPALIDAHDQVEISLTVQKHIWTVQSGRNEIVQKFTDRKEILIKGGEESRRVQIARRQLKNVCRKWDPQYYTLRQWQWQQWNWKVERSKVQWKRRKENPSWPIIIVINH